MIVGGDATPDLNPASDSSDSSSSESSAESGDDEKSDHFINVKSGMHHLRHESDPLRLRCGKLMRSIKSLRGADHTAAYASGSERCDGCFR